ncbi:MAG TPA: TraR/DksA C4-type zinc finger protein [Actinoplanes sp.]|jgi:DnaK suppressor protein
MLVNSAVITGQQAATGVAVPKGADRATSAGTGRSAEETDQIRLVLRDRFDELNAEYEDAVAQNQKLRLVEIGDAAGDDQADSGSKTAERDAALSLIRTLLDRRTQAEHAMQRLEDGTYGYCEGCTLPIPVERLTVFPSATTCVKCKQNRERRAG